MRTVAIEIRALAHVIEVEIAAGRRDAPPPPLFIQQRVQAGAACARRVDVPHDLAAGKKAAFGVRMISQQFMMKWVNRPSRRSGPGATYLAVTLLLLLALPALEPPHAVRYFPAGHA